VHGIELIWIQAIDHLNQQRMAYSDFKTIGQAIAALHLTLENVANLFEQVPEHSPSSDLVKILGRNLPLAINISTEKARAELLVSPILLEVRDAYPPISYFSGTSLNIDAAAGLPCECGFILSQSDNQLEVTAPIVTIVEAKNDNIKSGLGQCIAQMVGASRLNTAQDNQAVVIYGAVTTGVLWRFLKLLPDSILQIDLIEYVVPQQLTKVLGILTAPFQAER
jgi:hypothetical protein